jgi:predicted Zn-dependent protease
LGIALRDPDHLVLKQAVGVVYDVVALGYSRQDEFLADSLGVKYSLKAGYDPKAAFSLFKKMEGEGKTNNQLVFLMSHPPIKKRVEKIKTTLDELKLPTK